MVVIVVILSFAMLMVGALGLLVLVVGIRDHEPKMAFFSLIPLLAATAFG